ncbi:phosphotransferase [Bacillus sp. FJAT-49736]|uniref:phosphotransferase family protein n=1 Tax=Bacillus sp. FJAT-49736 TaxID=2833582 RepID=UPI001BC96C3A|nr:phosphotransferase [Bacillus sp. FJAT-49736]MBS4174384.1 phosphotransferase [Bacillus sp. FJAT-49736]
MELQFLFQEPIKEIHELSPGYSGHASDVWLVKTKNQEVVVRASRLTEEPNNDFWWGIKHTFGIDPRNVLELESVNNKLKKITSIPIPAVIGKGKSTREYVVVEKLEGQVVASFMDQPSSVLQSLGEGLARIHQHREAYAGNPAGTFQISLQQFHLHLSRCTDQLVSRFYSGNEKIVRMLPSVRELLHTLPRPEYSSFVLVDMDPSQFLSDGRKVTGLVDTEAYVLAPRELDFIALEYVLDEQAAKDFRHGYENIMPIPDLQTVRLPYRYFYRLLSIQGSVDLDEWLGVEKLF